MSNVVELIPRPGENASNNLNDLVSFYKRNSPFKVKKGWDWDDVYWDVKGICKTQSRKAGYSLYLYFSRDNLKGINVKTSRTDMQPFHHKELSDLVKVHVTALQIESAKDVGSLQLWVNAYRYLDNTLSKCNKPLADISLHDFKQAEAEAQSRLQPSTFYRVGSKLEGICKFINQKKLAKHKITFRKIAKRSNTHTNSDSRIDKESIDMRAEKLPSKASLIAVATLSNASLKGDDALFQSMVEISFATGLRIDEVISLDKDCLYETEIEERNVLTGAQDVFTVHEIRYKAKKGGSFRTKTVAESLVPILKKGIKTARRELEPVREALKALRVGDQDFFPALRSEGEIPVSEAYKALGWSSNSNFQTYLRKRKVPIHNRDRKINGSLRKVAMISPVDLKNSTSKLARESADGLWKSVEDKTVAERLEDMLFVTQHQRHHSKKSTEPWRYTLISHTQLSDYLAGRPKLGVRSVFERHNLTFEGESIRLTSHQFRHFLSTMLELSDTVSDIEVARYFGRKYIGDNKVYNHVNKSKKVMDRANEIIASTGISNDQAKEASILFTLVDKEEALETIDDLTTTLTTSIGLCKHDFNDSPCGKHYACLRGCAEYYRIKGNNDEVKEVKRIREDQRVRVEAAKRAVGDKFHNANNWLISHQELLNGCDAALEIENDDSVAVGEKVQVFPNGKTKCEAL